MDTPQGNSDRRGAGPVVFVGVMVLAAAVAVGGWLALRGGNRDTVPVASGDTVPAAAEDTVPPYLVLDPAPDGYRAMIIGDPTGEGEAKVDVWGRAGADDPFVDGDLVMVRLHAGPEGLGDSFGSAPTFEIAGRTVQPLDEEEGVKGVAWLDDDQATAVVMASISFDQATIVEVATGFLTSGQLDPIGLDLLADDAPFSSGPDPGPGLNEVAYVHHRELGDPSVPLTSMAGQPPPDEPPPDEAQPQIIGLAAASASEGSDVVAAWFATAFGDEESVPDRASEMVTVGDVTVEVVRYHLSGSGEVDWVEVHFHLPDGTEATLSTEGGNVEALVALIETVRWATPGEVEAMKQTFQEMVAEDAEQHPTTTMTVPATSTTGLSEFQASTTTSIHPTSTTGPPDPGPTTEPDPTATTAG